MAEDEEPELELVERLMTGEHGEFLASLLAPQRLPTADEVDEAQARTILMSLLAQLARRCVAVHLCQHCTYRDAYHFVLEELIYTERVPLEITGSGWTMNFDYAESCPECNADVEEEYLDFEPDQSSFEEGEEGL